ncbi:TPA: hypothetical protein ACJPUC_000373 [Streptococcus pyogenes]
MKTKSKRFLNLATLSLALLGTTLLMAQPVKAEVVSNPDENSLSVTSNDGGERDDDLRKRYLTERGLTDGNDLTDYDSEGARGYVDGYKAGSKPNAPEDPVAAGSYNPKNYSNSGGYNDGYETGYSAGRRKANDTGSFQSESEKPHDNSRSVESSDESHTPNGVEDSTGDSSDSSDLLSDIFKILVTFVLTWFGQY